MSEVLTEMINLTTNDNPSHRAVTKFKAEGPWTFDELFRVAVICATNQGCGFLGDALGGILHKFPPAELAKLLSPEQHLNAQQYELLCEGTGTLQLNLVPSRMTSEQLEVVAAYKHLGLGYIDWAKVSVATKLAILKDLAQLK